MKRWMSAMLALALCASAGLAEGAPDGQERVSEALAEAAQVAVPAQTPGADGGDAGPERAELVEVVEIEGADGAGEEQAQAPAIDEAEVEPLGAGDPGDAGFSDTDPDAAAEPEADAGAEGYVLDGAQRRTGSLAELLAEPGQKTVYVLAKQPVTIADFRLALLKDAVLLPDPELYPGERYAVKLMDGETELTPEAIAAATDEVVALCVSVVELLPGPDEPGGIRIQVEARNYEPESWMNWNPEFRLSGIPADAQGYSYVAVIYGERFIPLSEDFYIPMEEGVYTLRFAILDAQGDVVSSSEAYDLMLDLTPPELSVEVSQKRDYAMYLSATDAPGGTAAACSGVAEYSLDGGESWQPLGEGERVEHVESRRKTFPPQTILVRDLAGNIAGNAEQIVLDRLIDDSYTGGWGGGGGSTSEPKVPHASGSGDDTPYAAYELALPQGAVDVLTLGGEEIDLGLQVDGAGPEAFTAELTAWARENRAEEPAKDTLVVRARSSAAHGTHDYAWRINGSVLRKLYNSDIAYLALSAGDAVLSLPTVGFTAGTRYAELKMSGVSTAEFEYEIVMRPGGGPSADAWNLSQDCAVEISVAVAGERYEMIDRSATPEMYPYDVYCGPADLPDYPYGAYPGAEMEG